MTHGGDRSPGFAVVEGGRLVDLSVSDEKHDSANEYLGHATKDTTKTRTVHGQLTRS